MIGISLKPQDEISENFRQTVMQFVEKEKNNPELFKICYFDRMLEEPYKVYSEEIKQEYTKFYNAIYELEERLFPNRCPKGSKQHLQVFERMKLNPAQFEALNELNDFIEQLLSKEK